MSGYGGMGGGYGGQMGRAYGGQMGGGYGGHMGGNVTTNVDTTMDGSNTVKKEKESNASTNVATNGDKEKTNEQDEV